MSQQTERPYDDRDSSLAKALKFGFKIVGLPILLAWLPLSWLVRSLLGELQWRPPSWSHPLLRCSSKVGHWAARYPGRILSTLILLALLGTGAWQGHLWWKARPQPAEVRFHVTAPSRTELERDDPYERQPKPVTIRFEQSVAPLSSSGKKVEAGITIKPAIAGEWYWTDDKALSFFPEHDWPIGSAYTVSMEPGLVREEIRLAENKAVFETPHFKINLESAELYQDPTLPDLKQGVFVVQFSHPVQVAEFEKRIVLQHNIKAGGGVQTQREPSQFTVHYDKLKLRATIRSAALAIPKQHGVLNLELKKGVVAARGGPAFDSNVRHDLALPGLYSLTVTRLDTGVVNNQHGDPEQVLMVTTSATVSEEEIKKSVRAWVLPEKPRDGPGLGKAALPWDSEEVTDAVLQRSRVLSLQPIAGELDANLDHAFRYQAQPGEQIFFQVQAGLKAFGGYVMSQRASWVVKVPVLPAELKIVSRGSLLALRGEHKLAVLVRNLPGIKMEIGRILPGQLQHLVSQSEGDFSKPHFYGRFDVENLAERFETRMDLSALPRGKAQYQAIDLNRYLKTEGQQRRGVFLVRVSGDDPVSTASGQEGDPSDRDEFSGTRCENCDESDEEKTEQEVSATTRAPKSDQRLVVVTDLGIVAKRSLDGSQDIFVQSIDTGSPVAGAVVEIIGRNGLALLTRTTDASGRAHFANVDAMVRERAPMMILVTKGQDMSFLPMRKTDRTLDVSRFDTGGVRNATLPDQVSAYLFSDRGMYRPGETMRFGIIVKSANWSEAINGLPLEAEMVDARGLTIKREKIRLGLGGMAELSHMTPENAPAGTYSLNMYLVRDGKARAEIGSTTVKVRDFQPDRMKLSTELVNAQGPVSSAGWIHPNEIQGVLRARNLFGTPAEERRVTAQMSLTPGLTTFRRFPDYFFQDPRRATENHSEDLGESLTDEAGEATYDLRLERYARSIYRLHLVTRVFEPGGGGGVSGEVSALISELPYLVGFKSDGALGHLARGAKRVVSLLAINPATDPVAVNGLSLRHVERKRVSVLVKQDDGSYRYESRSKEVLLKEVPLSLPAGGQTLTLDSSTPGSFSYIIRDAEGTELNRIDYAVAGQGNLTRSLERNAELQLTLNKKVYQPGEDIEISIRAPYAGAGLVTIERDRVFTHHWFRAGTHASLQKIRLPKDFEGNGYVSVQFIRDPASDEIFTSPLSYGVVPFSTSLASRTNKLELTAPALVKPGQVAKMKLSATRPTKAIVFAVDEGILQVAGYQTPDALGFFFRKRMLEVRSSQILDLILPEFKRLIAASAPGGDSEGQSVSFLNPFKRKQDLPVAFWSGIVDVQGTTELDYQIPDSFNGSLRLMAVAVNENSIGTAERAIVVRGDFVISPNMPLAVSPGDEFDVNVAVSNNVVASGQQANVSVMIKTSPHVTLASGTATQSIRIAEGREGVVTYRLKATGGAAPVLGSASLVFTAAVQGKQSQLSSSLSVRPASLRTTQVNAGIFKDRLELPVQRQLLSQDRMVEVAVSHLPLALIQGLSAYLAQYPHQCTEQMVSQAFAAMVAAHRPEFARTPPPRAYRNQLRETFAALRTRQNAEGGYGMWQASVEADEFVSAYVTHLLLEARERGEAVPFDMLEKSLDYLRRMAGSPASSLQQLRSRAYAAYLLTRQMAVTTPILTSIRETLERRYPQHWRQDVAAGYLAASYQLQKQVKLADDLMAAQVDGLLQRRTDGTGPALDYVTDIRNAQQLYLLGRHFPSRMKALPPTFLANLVKPMASGRVNTLSAAYLIMSFDAYAAAIDPVSTAKLAVSEIDANGKTTSLPLPATVLPRTAFSSQASKLRLSTDGKLEAYYAVVESGYDLLPPKAELRAGLQVFREFLDSSGKPVTTAELGQELVVRLRFISTGRASIEDMALIDLLPGGVEPLLQTIPENVAQPESEDTHEDSTGEPGASRNAMRLLVDGAATVPVEHVDVREDRVMFYSRASRSIGEIRYRVRATSSGRFAIPPVYAESMYDHQVQGRSAGGQVMTILSSARRP